MYMATDEAVRERFHRISQNVSADSLDDIFHKLWTIAFDSRPLSSVNSLIGNGVRTKLIYTHAWFYIHKPSARGKINEQHI